MGLHHKPTHLSRADGQAYIIAQCIGANDPVFMVAHSTVVMPTRWYSSLEKNNNNQINKYIISLD